MYIFAVIAVVYKRKLVVEVCSKNFFSSGQSPQKRKLSPSSSTSGLTAAAAFFADGH